MVVVDTWILCRRCVREEGIPLVHIESCVVNCGMKMCKEQGRGGRAKKGKKGKKG